MGSGGRGGGRGRELSSMQSESLNWTKCTILWQAATMANSTTSPFTLPKHIPMTTSTFAIVLLWQPHSSHPVVPTTLVHGVPTRNTAEGPWYFRMAPNSIASSIMMCSSPAHSALRAWRPTIRPSPSGQRHPSPHSSVSGTKLYSLTCTVHVL